MNKSAKKSAHTPESQEGVVITGTKVIAELLSARPDSFLNIEVEQGVEDKIAQQLIERARLNKIPVLTRAAEPNEARIRARLKPKQPVELKALMAKQHRLPLIIGLDGVTDPQNLGSILRMAEAAGVSGVFMAKDRSCPLTSTVRTVSSGASELVDVCYVNNLAAALRELKEAQYWIVGSALTEDAVELAEAELPLPICLLLGSEGSGLRRLTLELCDFVVKIPMLGVIGSLNVSQAGSVIVFELLRRYLQQERGK